MNLNLNCKGFEPYLVRRVDLDEYLRGVQYIFRFHNGYGASVIKHTGSYGYYNDLWELAVLKYQAESYGICYDTGITEDVLGWLTDEEVCETLEKIKNL